MHLLLGFETLTWIVITSQTLSLYSQNKKSKARTKFIMRKKRYHDVSLLIIPCIIGFVCDFVVSFIKLIPIIFYLSFRGLIVFHFIIKPLSLYLYYLICIISLFYLWFKNYAFTCECVIYKFTLKIVLFWIKCFLFEKWLKTIFLILV